MHLSQSLGKMAAASYFRNEQKGFFMIHSKTVVVVLASLLAVPTAHAAIDLIAIGSLSGNTQDLSAETSAPLENGTPGNLLGGIGSGFAYAGGNTFLALPDRGPNAMAYNPAVDDTTSYIARFHTIQMTLAPSTPGSSLPFTLTPTLKATTLLSSRHPLYYGTGVNVGATSGTPALNSKHAYYFVGRSDNFDASKLSTDPNNARLDPESIRLADDGEHLYISDEYGPYVYQFHRRTGQRLHSYRLPDSFAVASLNAKGDTEITGNTKGRVANKGMEGLAITPDGETLIGAMQSPLLQDNGTNGRFCRIVVIDVDTSATREYAYELSNIGTATKPKYPTISDIVAINDHEFLVDERDGKGLGDNSTAVYKKIYRIDLSGAHDVSNLTGEANLSGQQLPKTLFLDLVAAFNAHGIGSNDIPAKLEGMAFGPDVVSGGVTKHTLFVTNDNDFIGTVTDSNHPASIDNANKFFVFAIDAADLPDFEPQDSHGNGHFKDRD
jgi:hypothetical protein